jgi:hypothetical protein
MSIVSNQTIAQVCHHQLLKVAMYTDKQSCYAGQRKLLWKVVTLYNSNTISEDVVVLSMYFAQKAHLVHLYTLH